MNKMATTPRQYPICKMPSRDQARYKPVIFGDFSLLSFYHNVATTKMSPLRGFMHGAEFQNRLSVALKLHSHSVKRGLTARVNWGWMAIDKASEKRKREWIRIRIRM